MDPKVMSLGVMLTNHHGKILRSKESGEHPTRISLQTYRNLPDDFTSFSDPTKTKERRVIELLGTADPDSKKK